MAWRSKDMMDRSISVLSTVPSRQRPSCIVLEPWHFAYLWGGKELPLNMTEWDCSNLQNNNSNRTECKPHMPNICIIYFISQYIQNVIQHGINTNIDKYFTLFKILTFQNQVYFTPTAHLSLDQPHFQCSVPHLTGNQHSSSIGWELVIHLSVFFSFFIIFFFMV